MKKWPHYAGDGQPRRDVFLNDKKIEHVLAADDVSGIVKVAVWPIRVDKRKKQIRSKILRGTVRVEIKK